MKKTYNLDKILQKLESNVMPKSMRHLDIGKWYKQTMDNLEYEIVSEPIIIRPAIVQEVFANCIKVS